MRVPWRLGTGQGNQLGLLLAVKNGRNSRHRARLAAQHGLEAFFHQLFVHPVNHGWAGFQSFDDISLFRCSPLLYGCIPVLNACWKPTTIVFDI